MPSPIVAMSLHWMQEMEAFATASALLNEKGQRPPDPLRCVFTREDTDAVLRPPIQEGRSWTHQCVLSRVTMTHQYDSSLFGRDEEAGPISVSSLEVALYYYCYPVYADACAVFADVNSCAIYDADVITFLRPATPSNDNIGELGAARIV